MSVTPGPYAMHRPANMRNPAVGDGGADRKSVLGKTYSYQPNREERTDG
jgi:hypothetical protein